MSTGLEIESFIKANAPPERIRTCIAFLILGKRQPLFKKWGHVLKRT